MFFKPCWGEGLQSLRLGEHRQGIRFPVSARLEPDSHLQRRIKGGQCLRSNTVPMWVSPASSATSTRYVVSTAEACTFGFSAKSLLIPPTDVYRPSQHFRSVRQALMIGGYTYTFWKIMKRIRIALPAFALMLAACSAPVQAQDGPTAGTASTSAGSPSTTAAGAAMPAGRYELTTASGAHITFTLPTPATNPAVVAIEAYRVKVGAAPVSYVVADVDNREGTAPVNMYMVSAFSEGGRQFTFSSVADAIHGWAPTYSHDFKWSMDGRVLEEAEGAALKREADDLYDADISNVDTAERTTVILASSDAELPTGFTRVAVQPLGAVGEEEAQPAR